MEKVGTYKFMAEPFKADVKGNLFMSALGNYMLNAADFQSAERNFGYLDLRESNKAWVLSRFVIDISEMPKSYEHFHISTWVESAMRFFTRRNWSIQGDGGKQYGYGCSVWAMIDLETRQPADIFAIGNGIMKEYVDEEHTVPIEPPSRVRMNEKEAKLVREIDTVYNDIDINGHVNSVRYIEHALDILPLEWHSNNFIRRLEVAYVAEAHFGDKLRFYEDRQSEDEICYRISALQPDGKEQECCRIKILVKSK